MAVRDLTLARLREVLDYDPGTGAFTWKVRLSDNVPPGQVAGKCGTISIDGNRHRATRLAWFYVHGEWPTNRALRNGANTTVRLSDLSFTCAPRLARGELSADVLRQFLHYDPKSGDFIWIRKTRCKTVVGDVAGSFSKNNKYIYISIFRTTYLAHRLAWFYMTGKWPQGQIDHIDGDRSNNRWDNLRDVPAAGNAQNRRVPRVDCSSGFIGVAKKGNRFAARITYEGGRYKYLGMFSTAEEAHAAYVMAKREIHEFNTL